MPMRNANVVSTFLVLKRDNQILLLKRQNTGYRDGEYGVVSGHVEAGESYTQATVREAKEEAGIDLDPASLYLVHAQHRKSAHDGSERVDLYFSADEWSGEIKNCEPNKCSELKWFDLDELPENTIPGVKIALEEMRRDQIYSEYGWS